MAVAESCLGFEVAKVVRTISHLWQIFGIRGVAGFVVSIFKDGNFENTGIYRSIGLGGKMTKSRKQGTRE